MELGQGSYCPRWLLFPGQKETRPLHLTTTWSSLPLRWPDRVETGMAQDCPASTRFFARQSFYPAAVTGVSLLGMQRPLNCRPRATPKLPSRSTPSSTALRIDSIYILQERLLYSPPCRTFALADISPQRRSLASTPHTQLTPIHIHWKIHVDARHAQPRKRGRDRGRSTTEHATPFPGRYRS